MAVKGGNFWARKARLQNAWTAAVNAGDYGRTRLARMAYYRLDDHLRSTLKD